MKDKTALEVWMESKGYTNRTLAEKMGFSYEWIFKLSTGAIPHLSRSFKWRFIECFGRDEANKIFDADPQPISASEQVTA